MFSCSFHVEHQSSGHGHLISSRVITLGPRPLASLSDGRSSTAIGPISFLQRGVKVLNRIGESALQLSQSRGKATGEHRQNPKER